MRVAICLQGLSSGKSDVAPRGHQSKVEGNFQVCIDGSIANLFRGHDVDFFTHTWGSESSEIISRFLTPVKSLYEKQIQFAPKGDYKHSVKSRWYSTKMSVSLMEQHQKESGDEYDFVFMSRYDVRYFNDFSLETLAKNKFYASHWVTDKPDEDGLLDYWFLTNAEMAIKFASLYDVIDDLLLEKPYPSSHWLAVQHLQNEGIRSHLEFLKHEKIDFNLTRRVEGWTNL